MQKWAAAITRWNSGKYQCSVDYITLDLRRQPFTRSSYHPTMPGSAAALTGFLLVLSVQIGATSCPRECACRWKGGKETVECVSQGLGGIPQGLEGGTQVLDLTGNSLQVLQKNAFLRAGLINLQRVYMASCRLTQVDRHAFSRLTNLIELDLSNNQLAMVPSESFRETHELRRLLLNNNPLRRLERATFAHLPNLVHLELSRCQIDLVAAGAFEGLPSITTLKLNGNLLTSLPATALTPLPPGLHEVDFHDNPWYCDCTLKDLRKWFVVRGVPTHPVAPTCSGPPRLVGFEIERLGMEDFACPPTVLTIGPSPPSDPQSPVFTNAQLVDMPRGSNVSFMCRFGADPQPLVHWTWQDIVISNISTGTTPMNRFLELRSYTVEESGTTDKTSILTVSGVEESDSGEYMCVAENRGGRATVNFTLGVMTASEYPSATRRPGARAGSSNISNPGSSRGPTRGFLWGIFVSLSAVAAAVLLAVITLSIRFCVLRHRRSARERRLSQDEKKHPKMKLVHSETQETTKGGSSSGLDSPLETISCDKNDIQLANPVQKPPRSFANSSYADTTDAPLNRPTCTTVCGLNLPHDGLESSVNDGHASTFSPNTRRGVRSIAPDLINVDATDPGGVYSVPRGNTRHPLCSHSLLPTSESPVPKCHGCDNVGCLRSVPCLHIYGTDGDPDESDRCIGAEYRIPNTNDCVYDTVKPPVSILEQQESKPLLDMPGHMDNGFDVSGYATVSWSNVPEQRVIHGKQWQGSLPRRGHQHSYPQPAVVAGASSCQRVPRQSHFWKTDGTNSSDPKKGSSTNNLSPYPLLNLSNVRDSPDEGYEDEGDEGTEV